MKTYLTLLLVLISFLGLSQLNIVKESQVGRIFDMQPYTNDGFIANRQNKLYKFDVNTVFEWGKTIPTASGLKAKADPDGNIVCIANHGHSNPTVPMKAFKLSGTGQIIEAKDLGITSTTSNIEIIDNGYVITFVGANPNSNSKDLIVCRTDSAFNPIWTRAIKNPLVLSFRNMCTKVNDNNEISILGVYETFALDFFSVITKLDGNGQLMWSKRWGENTEFYQHFDLLPDGGYVAVAGRPWEEFAWPLRVSVCDSTGTILSTRTKDYLVGATAGSSDAHVVVKSDGRYVVGMYHHGSHGTYNNTAWIFFDNHIPVQDIDFYPPYLPTLMWGETANTVIWSRTNEDEFLYSADVTSDDGDFTTANNYFGQFSWYDDSCEVGTLDLPVFALTLDSTTNFPVTLDSINLIASSTGSGLSNAPFTDTLLCKNKDFDTTSTVGIDYLGSDMHLSMYPNPSNGMVSIATEQSPIETVLVYDKVGQLVVRNTSLKSTKVELDLSHLNNGSYFVRVLSEGRSRTVPLILIKP